MRKTKKSQKEFITLGSIIKNVIQKYRYESDADMAEIWSLWNEAVGDAIAANAQPAAFNKDLLIVHVTSSPWLQQLQFLKKEIQEKINAIMGKALVKEIKFKIGPL